MPVAARRSPKSSVGNDDFDVAIMNARGGGDPRGVAVAAVPSSPPLPAMASDAFDSRLIRVRRIRLSSNRAIYDNPPKRCVAFVSSDGIQSDIANRNTAFFVN